jgi:hypothetical protein
MRRKESITESNHKLSESMDWALGYVGQGMAMAAPLPHSMHEEMVAHLLQFSTVTGGDAVGG